MDPWTFRNGNRSALYAQNCPEEPLILESTVITEEPSIQVAKPSPKHQRSNISYHPHIITSKKWSQSNVKPFQEIEHERQLSILQVRIRNCKSLTQRKKDRNDPILYPAYFIREKKRCKDARIDGYFRKVVEGGGEGRQIRRRQTHKPIKHRQEEIKLQQEQQVTRQSFWRAQQQDQNRFTRSNYPLPPVTHQELHRKDYKQQKSLLNLPSPNSQSIASFIIDRKMFLEDDLRILKARLFHNFGENIEKQWREALYYVLRSKPPS